MDLFNPVTNGTYNLLPSDGEAIYYGSVINRVLADKYYENLLSEIAWNNDQAFIYGKLIITKRKVAWYGDRPFKYTYSKVSKQALPWTDTLQEIKSLIEEKTNERYNSCLLNLYHNGSEGMAWHSDGEKDLKKNGAIGSVSFGALRKFAFKHKESKETVSVNLEHGSILVMKGATQTNWLHRLPPTKKVQAARINLTFRTIEEK